MCTIQLHTLLYVIGVFKVAYIVNKPPLMGENAFPRTEIVGILFIHNSSCIKSMQFLNKKYTSATPIHFD